MFSNQDWPAKNMSLGAMLSMKIFYKNARGSNGECNIVRNWPLTLNKSVRGQLKVWEQLWNRLHNKSGFNTLFAAPNLSLWDVVDRLESPFVHACWVYLFLLYIYFLFFSAQTTSCLVAHFYLLNGILFFQLLQAVLLFYRTKWEPEISVSEDKIRLKNRDKIVRFCWNPVWTLNSKKHHDCVTWHLTLEGEQTQLCAKLISDSWLRRAQDCSLDTILLTGLWITEKH